MKWQDRFTKLMLNSGDFLPELMVTNLNSWRIISVTGKDRKLYLQGQLTCDLGTLDPQESTLGAHCDAKGKVWSIFRCFTHKQGYALLHNASTIEISLREIKKYSVFSKVEFDISPESILGIMGRNADKTIDNLTSERGKLRSIQGGSAVKIEKNRWLLVIDKNKVESLLNTIENACFVDEKIWDKFDIEGGIPRIVDPIQNSQIPQAFNLQAIGGISFNKGCYTGQETVARAKYRGTNKRFMAIVKGNLDDSTSSTLNLERSVGENWRNIGSIFTYYSYADGTTIGLIILPNNLEPETKLRLTENPSSIWEIEDLPYKIEE